MPPPVDSAVPPKAAGLATRFWYSVLPSVQWAAETAWFHRPGESCVPDYLTGSARSIQMPKFLIEVSYTAEGARGLLKDGGTKRLAAAKALVASVGGTLEAMYYAFGDTDAVVIVDAPDAASA